LLRPDGAVELVAVAETFDRAFVDEPADRSDPQLFALIAAIDDDDAQIAHWPDVDHELLMWQIVPPPDCLVLVLVTTGWAAPLDDDGECRTRPSRHPERRRSHTVTAIGNEGEMVSVLRIADEAPTVLTGACYGRAPDALRRCWARRSSSGAPPLHDWL
jgi:hypothetical protein